MDTSSFSRDRSCTYSPLDCRRSTCIATVDVGAVEQRPRAVVFYLEPLVVLIMAQFVFAVYSRLQPRYIPPQRRRPWSGGQETRNVRCLRPARPCFSVYCMCMLSTSFAQIFCGVCMVHGSRGAKKRWYKDALQTSLTGNNDIHR